MFLTLQLAYIKSHAQFFTISADSLHRQIQGAGLAQKHPDRGKEETIFPIDSLQKDSSQTFERERELFPEARGCEISIEKDVPVFVSVKNNPLFELIQKRVTVCLPLDYLKVNSCYGFRSDPVYHCKKFHDGIDLNCRYEHVYSMLPGTMKEVHYGNKGYGNYVILQHGNIECLYGHLSLIAVHENDIVQAGDIVAISGNTGKSTGPHLHIRLRKEGTSIDPQPFITYLNNYISDLQERIATLKFGEEPDMELNLDNLAKALEKYHVKYPRIVIAQALLETGYFTSRVCWECKNLFGLRRPSNGSYYKFDHWEESVKAYRDYVQYKYKGGDYFRFLDLIGYAEDKTYTMKVRQIAKSL